MSLGGHLSGTANLRIKKSGFYVPGGIVNSTTVNNFLFPFSYVRVCRPSKETQYTWTSLDNDRSGHQVRWPTPMIPCASRTLEPGFLPQTDEWAGTLARQRRRAGHLDVPRIRRPRQPALRPRQGRPPLARARVVTDMMRGARASRSRACGSLTVVNGLARLPPARPTLAAGACTFPRFRIPPLAPALLERRATPSPASAWLLCIESCDPVDTAGTSRGTPPLPEHANTPCRRRH